MTTAVPTMRALVERVFDRVEPFDPGQKLTTFASWFRTPDDGTLVLAVGPGRSEGQAATAAAHALAWRHDRELALLLPSPIARAVAARVAHIDPPVRVWAVDDGRAPRPVPIPGVDDLVAEARSRPIRRGKGYDLGERADWVRDLLAGATAHWALEAAHRDNYLAWHCAGRQVLKLSRRGQGVHIEAGVQYSKPPQDRPPLAFTVTAPLTGVQRAQVESAVAVAVADRLSGRDDDHVEHRMQAAIGVRGLRDLGLVELEREYPAWRGEDADGYIDFLGLDEHGQLHVVETKVGPDAMLVGQALDYATWVRAHAPAIRRGLGWCEGDDSVVHIDFVLAPKAGARGNQPAFGPYTAGQLEALAADVSWRVHLVEDARTDVPVITSLPPRTLPAPQPGMVAERIAVPRRSAERL